MNPETWPEFARQAAWPRERVHGWAPGSYSCTCGDCGVHYLGDKRSVQCYPCVAKFVPPPRPETPEEIRADRDRLAAELATAHEEIALSRQSEGETMADLLATRAELARVRRNHLRRMLGEIHDKADRMLWGSRISESAENKAWCKRHLPRIERFSRALRAAISQPTKTGGG